MSARALPAKGLASGLWEFTRFLFVGGMAAIANLATRYVVDLFVYFELAVLVGYLVGAIIAFFAFQRSIFGNPGTPVRQQMMRFALVNLLGLGLTLLISSLLARQIFPAIGWTFRPYDIAHFLGVCAPAFSSYVLHKHYTYK